MNKKKSTKLLLISIALSIVMHFLLAYVYHDTQPKENRKTEEYQVSYNNKNSKNKSEHIWFNSGKKPCNHYDGIGIQYNAISGIVSSVAINGPADIGGLKIGDELLTPVWYMDFKFGEVVEIKVKREDTILIFNVKVDRICTDETN